MMPALRTAPSGAVPPRTEVLPAEDPRRRAARAFEAQALGQLLRPMFDTVDASRGTFGGGAGEAQWRPMLVDAYATAIARAGGLGIAEAVHRALLWAQETRAAAAAPRAQEGGGR